MDFKFWVSVCVAVIFTDIALDRIFFIFGMTVSWILIFTLNVTIIVTCGVLKERKEANDNNKN